MPSTCIVCGQTKGKETNVSLHRIPANPAKRQQWMMSLNLVGGDIRSHHRVCSRHFPSGDISLPPSLALGKRFASPKKHETERAKRAIKRSLTPLHTPQPPLKHQRYSPNSTGESSQHSQQVTPDRSDTTASLPLLSVQVGEQLMCDYSIHEFNTEPLPEDHSLALSSTVSILKAENLRLKQEMSSQRPSIFRIERILHDDSLVIRFYTGFHHEVLLALFEFLGPAVNHLKYWSRLNTSTATKPRTKLDPLNQLFLTLVKLRLDCHVVDLGVRFGISPGLVSRYFTTWVCFLYQELKEIDWMPTTDQVSATLPPAFKEKYPSTYALIDASEVFMETPSDLQFQSSTWSNYKHHNTVKFLVAVTPVGAVSFISPLYVGSISDVELTRVSGFLQLLANKPGISIMADRGFTIQDELDQYQVKLNIPPFMEGRIQLPPDEIKSGRQIASLRIHVERAIGRIKNYGILKGTIPITMARIANQIVCVCALLTNFQPALVTPLNSESDESAPTDCEVEDYFESLEDDSCSIACDN